MPPWNAYLLAWLCGISRVILHVHVHAALAAGAPSWQCLSIGLSEAAGLLFGWLAALWGCT